MVWQGELLYVFICAAGQARISGNPTSGVPQHRDRWASPLVSTQTAATWMERQLQEGRGAIHILLDEYLPLLDQLRAAWARLLGAGPDEIALTHHTTEGMNIAIWGLNWQPGDEIVTTNMEHEGAALPVNAVARRFGLSVRPVDLRSNPGDLVGSLTAALSPRTRLLVCSHVSYLNGASPHGKPPSELFMDERSPWGDTSLPGWRNS